MSKNERLNPEQEQLFVASGDVVAPIQFDTDIGQVNLLERAIRLRNTLDLLAQENYRRSFVLNPDAQSFYGERAQFVVEGASKKADEYHKAAKWEFARAYGLFAMEHTDEAEKIEHKRETGLSFDDFRFGNDPNRPQRLSADELRRKFEDQIRTNHEAVSVANRESGARPHKLETVKTKHNPELVEDSLSTRDKLVAIFEDPRAGFIPTTHKEKNSVMTFLDYLDNPEYKLDVRNQLLEVVRYHHKTNFGSPGYDYGRQAVVSIAEEFGDYYTQAGAQLEELYSLRELLAEEVGPHLKINMVLLDKLPLAIPLIRYMDLVAFRRDGSVSHSADDSTVSLNRDPLRTIRNEDQAREGKNKTIEDQYTSAQQTKHFKDWLVRRSTQITLGEAKKWINSAIEDQQKRKLFHELILQGLDKPKASVELGLAAETAHNILFPVGV